MSLYYQPSNKMPVSGALICLLGGVVAAAVLAVVYVYAIWYIPFVYINLFICLGFGFALAMVMILLVRAGKIRNPRGASMLSLVVGLAAVYLEWTMYLTLLLNSETTGTGKDADTSTSFSFSLFVDVLTHPARMWEYILRLNETGSWSLKGATPSGTFLWLIWAIELLLIVGLPYLLARSQASDPFSESANEWAEEEALAHPIGFASDVASTRSALESGQFNSLTPHLTEADEEQFARLRLYHVPNDPFCHYLTLDNVTKKLDSKGKSTETTENVVQHLTISSATYQELKRRFGTLPVATRQAAQESV
jgi:hypothetical protein